MNGDRFTLQFDDDERLMMLSALGYASIPIIDKPQCWVIKQLIRKLSDVRADANRAANPQSGTEAAKAVLAPPEQGNREKFEDDRNGEPQTSPPEGAELKTVRILQADEDLTKTGAPILKVIFSGGKANCFAKSLWGSIKPKAASQADLGLWLLRSKDGKYLNIVGVRV
jgi:hypothetical protein